MSVEFKPCPFCGSGIVGALKEAEVYDPAAGDLQKLCLKEGDILVCRPGDDVVQGGVQAIDSQIRGLHDLLAGMGLGGGKVKLIVVRQGTMLETVAAKTVAAEREACAKLCEEYPADASFRSAKRIRARGQA